MGSRVGNGGDWGGGGVGEKLRQLYVNNKKCGKNIKIIITHI